MNSVSLVGRLVRDPEVKYTTGENAMAIARITVACDRRFANKNGEREADFISCQAFGKTAEFLEKYFKKGMRIGLTGRIQTGSYVNKDGNKVYTTDVVIDNCEFVESKGSGNGADYTAPKATGNEAFMAVPENADDDGLPFM